MKTVIYTTMESPKCDNNLTLLQEVDEKEGKVAQNIQRYYGLCPTLCHQYAAIIYIIDNRIDVAPRKYVNSRLRVF